MRGGKKEKNKCKTTLSNHKPPAHPRVEIKKIHGLRLVSTNRANHRKRQTKLRCPQHEHRQARVSHTFGLLQSEIILATNPEPLSVASLTNLNCVAQKTFSIRQSRSVRCSPSHSALRPARTRGFGDEKTLTSSAPTAAFELARSRLSDDRGAQDEACKGGRFRTQPWNFGRCYHTPIQKLKRVQSNKIATKHARKEEVTWHSQIFERTKRNRQHQSLRKIEHNILLNRMNLEPFTPVLLIHSILPNSHGWQSDVVLTRFFARRLPAV